LRRVLVRHGWLILPLLALAILFLIDPALAQDTATDEKKPKQTSAFIMFFTSDTVLGWIIIWGLITMSVCVMALVIQAIMVNRRSVLIPPDNVLLYEEMIEEKRYPEAIERAATDDSVFGQILHASLSEAANGYGAMERAIEETADLVGSKRVRALEMLNVMGAVGPMIGLFGTVYGMIVAFQTIVDKGGQPDPSELAAGISTALVTTFWGLIVGIPAVASAALIRNRIDGLMVEAMIEAEAMISRFKPGKKQAGAGAGAAAGGGAPAAGGGPKPKPAT